MTNFEGLLGTLDRHKVEYIVIGGAAAIALGSAMDVYGLAVVAFEMLTGIRYRRLEERSEDGLRRALMGFHTALPGLLAAGANYDPKRRPQDIREFAKELARCLE